MNRDEEKVGVQPIKLYAERMKAERISRAIVVVRQGISPMTKQALREVATRGTRIEYFKDAELLVDITEHKCVLTP
jgi:hypothetical protein